MNLDEYEVILNASSRFKACKIAEDLMKTNALQDMLFMGVKPITKWQKFKYKIKDYKQRCKDIWTILKGSDIHENCGQ